MKTRRWGLLLLGLFLFTALLALWRLRGAGERDSSPSLAAQEAIAVVKISGPLTVGAGDYGAVDVDRLVQKLKSMRKRKEIKAVLLRINTPGGSVAAVQEIHQEILALKDAGKIIVSSFGDIAASGGYYIAAPSHQIVANPGSLTGSIGVIFQMGNVEGLLQKVGVSMETIKSGAAKDAGSPFRAMTTSERAHFQSIVKSAYDQFFQAVSQGRGELSEATLRELADGRIFTGAQALEAGLVDSLGNFNSAVEVARQLSGIKAAEPRLVYTTTPVERVLHFLGARFGARPWPLNRLERKVRLDYLWE